MKPFERHLWLFLPLIWQHVIRATSWLPSVFRFQRLIIMFKLNFPTFLTYHLLILGSSVLSGMEMQLKIAVRSWCWMGTGFVANIFCCSYWICKNIFCLFLVCLQRRWPQKRLQRTEGPPLGSSSGWNGDGNVVLRDINRLNGQARADVCKNVYIVQKSCVPFSQPVVLVRVFSRFLVPSCDFHVPVFRSSWQSWCETFFERKFECREYQCLLFLRHLLPSGFAAANYIFDIYPCRCV